MANTADKKRASCAHCGASFTVPVSAEGKSAKCPKCGNTFTISFPRAATSSPPSPAPAAATPSLPSAPTALRRITVPFWVIVAAPAVVSLILGYFAGREHLKYQMRSAFTNAGRAFAEGIKDSLPPGLRQGLDEPEDKPTPPPRIRMGDLYDAGRFTVQVVRAAICHPEVRNITGDVSPSKDPLLVIEMKFTNKDDRRKVSFRDDRVMGGPIFGLRDDVENTVRPVTFGIANRVVGALEKFAELNPESSITHLQVFDTPLPKTKSLVLTVDLYCFEGEGEVEVDIPFDQVVKEE